MIQLYLSPINYLSIIYLCNSGEDCGEGIGFMPALLFQGQ